MSNSISCARLSALLGSVKEDAEYIAERIAVGGLRVNSRLRPYRAR